MSKFEELILELPLDLQQEVEDFVHFLLRKHAGKSSQDEAGAMKDYRGQYQAKQAAPELDNISILYQKLIKSLPVTDRLHLMQLIMAGLAESASGWVVEESSVWSHEDLLDLGRASLQYAGKTLPGEEQVANATTPFDCLLEDWVAAGLHRATAFRAFLVTLPSAAVKPIGHCSKRDWQAIQLCVSRAIAIQS